MKSSNADSPAPDRRRLAAAAAALLVASAVAAGASPLATGVAAASSDVTACTTIDEPGAYELARNLTQSGDDPCLRIAASGVTLDGDGHAVDGASGADAPRVVASGSGELVDVTVSDLRLLVDSPGAALRFDGVSDGRIADVYVDPPAVGSAAGRVAVVGDRNTVTGVTGYASVSVVGDDNRVVETTANGLEGAWGVSVDGDRNRVRDVTAGALLGGIVVSGRHNRVANASFYGGYGPGVTVANATGTVVANATATGAPAARLANGTNPSVRDSDLSSDSDDALVATGTTGAAVANTTLSAGAGAGVTLVGSDDNAFRGNAVRAWLGVVLRESENNTLRGNAVRSTVGFDLGAGAASNRLYDNRIEVSDSLTLDAGTAAGPNKWNVSRRPGENVVGGPTVGGNYYANEEGTGYSQTCEDADGDGICDSPYRLSENNTDYLPLAEPNDTERPGDGNDSASAVTDYQVDFVAGVPIENLSADRLYADQDRLMRYAFGDVTAGITDRGSAWAAETLRECVDYAHIVSVDGGDTAQVGFTVAENCSDVTLTLAVYSMPGEEFDASTADQQELLNSTTETFGPGEHTIAVDLPDSDESDGSDK